MIVDRGPSQHGGKQSMSININEFLSDLTHQNGRHASVVVDGVLHIRWKNPMERPISIDVIDLLTDDFGFSRFNQPGGIRREITADVVLHIR